MKLEEKVLLELIRQSQFGKTVPICFDNVDFDMLYQEAFYHAVLGLIAPEIPSEHMNDKWNTVLYRYQASYIRYCNYEADLIKIFDSAKIPLVILKGNAVAYYYRIPCRRSMGDIDFLVSYDNYPFARTVLESNGFVLDHETSRHASYIKNGMVYELHHRFSHEIDLEEYIIDGLNNRKYVSIDGHEFPMNPRLANGLVLLDHIMNHIKSALGIRQVVDWMMYVYNSLDDDFWRDSFQIVVHDKGMEELAIVLTRVCQLYLGLSDDITWCKSANPQTCRLFIDCILSSGNFGRKNGLGKKVELVSLSVRSKGFFHWLQKAGEHNWKAYHKYNWLKPFCWIYQTFRYSKQTIKSRRKHGDLFNDISRSKKRIKLLKELGIL